MYESSNFIDAMYTKSDRELIDILASTALNLFGSDRELEHDSAVLALLLAHLGRRDFVDGLATTAFDLLWPGNELKH